ncbi:MAG: DegT/DnrJ/EryC1/StrS family aminotransferase [Bryobacteraceae bacterium]|nr:DegT/DnrJ/EryC1/StrS family aminotransferase [Bryobacteraceae bacterium]
MRIPLTDLRPQLEATQSRWRPALDRLLARAQFVLGREGEAFEREFARATGAAWVVGVGSGTVALELCLRTAIPNKPRKEVLVPALTSLFTAQAVLAAGCVPRFADVDPETLLLDPGDARDRIRSKTAAIVAVHLYGQPCDLRALAALSRRHGLALIQDACQAHGAQFQGHPLTAYSRWVAYSFYPTKNLGCLGDGGAVATDSSVIARRIRLLRDGGRQGGQVSRLQSTHSRLDEIQACFLRSFLPQLPRWNAARRRLASLYDEALAGCEEIRPVRRSADSVNHLYVIRARRRDALREHLRQNGIVTGIHYPVPLHLQPAFREFGPPRGSLPNAEKACREILSLPLWPFLKEDQILRVAETIRRFYL